MKETAEHLTLTIKNAVISGIAEQQGSEISRVTNINQVMTKTTLEQARPLT